MAVLPLTPSAFTRADAASNATTSQSSTTHEVFDWADTASQNSTINKVFPSWDPFRGMPIENKAIIYFVLLLVVGGLFIIFSYYLWYCGQKCGTATCFCCYEDVDDEGWRESPRQNDRQSWPRPLANYPTGTRPSGHPTNSPAQSTPNNQSSAPMAGPEPAGKRPETPPPVYNCDPFPPPYDSLPRVNE
ncbi:hypothetical protein NW762_005267 [Fusarium torreyae]|uniref:Uncharacterized protein n=1 Tax=Fusarium torreyae TaxID=1237075 RepID=A0A9W8VJD0_9HYPO|nr:hypothetical protein NW762_005267 [Fusarium torreyae]